MAALFNIQYYITAVSSEWLFVIHKPFILEYSWLLHASLNYQVTPRKLKRNVKTFQIYVWNIMALPDYNDDINEDEDIDYHDKKDRYTNEPATLSNIHPAEHVLVEMP